MITNIDYGKYVNQYNFSVDGLDYKYAVFIFDNYNKEMLEVNPNIEYTVENTRIEEVDTVDVSYVSNVEETLNSFNVFTKNFDQNTLISNPMINCVIPITDNYGNDLSDENLEEQVEKSLNRFKELINDFNIFIFIKTTSKDLMIKVKNILENTAILKGKPVTYVQDFSKKESAERDIFDKILEEFYDNSDFGKSDKSKFSKLLKLLLVELDSKKLALNGHTDSYSLFNKRDLSDIGSTPKLSRETIKLINEKINIVVDKCNNIEKTLKKNFPNLYGLVHPIVYIGNKGLEEKEPQQLHTTFRHLIFDIYRRTKCSIYAEESISDLSTIYLGNIANPEKMYIEDIFSYIENEYIILVDNSFYHSKVFYRFENVRPCFTGFRVELNITDDIYLNSESEIEPINSVEDYSHSDVISIKDLLTDVESCKRFKTNVFDVLYDKEDKVIPKYLTIKKALILKKDNKIYLYYIKNFKVKFDLCMALNPLGVCSKIDDISNEKFLSLLPLDFFGNSRFILPSILKGLHPNQEEKEKIGLNTCKNVDTHKSLLFTDLSVYLNSYPDISTDFIDDVKDGSISDCNLKFLDVIAYFPITNPTILKNFNNEMIELTRKSLKDFRKNLDCFGGCCKLFVNEYVVKGDEFYYGK